MAEDLNIFDTYPIEISPIVHPIQDESVVPDGDPVPEPSTLQVIDEGAVNDGSVVHTRGSMEVSGSSQTPDEHSVMDFTENTGGSDPVSSPVPAVISPVPEVISPVPEVISPVRVSPGTDVKVDGSDTDTSLDVRRGNRIRRPPSWMMDGQYQVGQMSVQEPAVWTQKAEYLMMISKDPTIMGNPILLQAMLKVLD